MIMKNDKQEKQIIQDDIKNDGGVSSEVNEKDQPQGSINNFKCDSCGANMHYDAEAQGLKCDHCGKIKKLIFSGEVTERDFSELAGAEIWKDGVKTVICSNCGAREVYRADEAAKVCPFCHSAMVLSTSDFSGIKPNVVIPFKVTPKDANLLCRKWLKKRFYAPRAFKKNIKLEGIQGLYYPVWTFDSQTMTDYDGVLGRTVTRTRTVNGKTETYTETQYFHVSGKMFNMFDEIVVNGGKAIDDNTINKIKFAKSEYVKFNDDFLAGYSANSYSIEPLDAWKIAEQKMREIIKNEIMNKHNASCVQSLNMRLFHEGKSFKYMLIPVYLSVAKYKEKLYRQFIHGTVGKVSGKTPISALKVIITVLLGLGLIALGVWLYITYGKGGEPIIENIKQYLPLI
ncbi:MAG: hypothetical protein RR054_02250 [Clostridia bacterium]